MEQTKKEKTTLSVVLIGLKLLLICAIVAGVISFVFSLTDEKYNQNMLEAKSRAVEQIYAKEGLLCETVSESDGTVVSRVLEQGSLIGYCVEVSGNGFGGDIQLMVGYTADAKILGVSIVTHSETPGLGSKVDTPQFLSQFAGESGELVLGEDIDAVSGASISSKGVTSGVNLATEALQKALKGGAANE